MVGLEGVRVEAHTLEARVGGKLHYDMIAHAPEQVALGVELPAPLVCKIKRAAKPFDRPEVADDDVVRAVRDGALRSQTERRATHRVGDQRSGSTASTVTGVERRLTWPVWCDLVESFSRARELQRSTHCEGSAYRCLARSISPFHGPLRAAVAARCALTTVGLTAAALLPH
jgi:hypothetical protein